MTTHSRWPDGQTAAVSLTYDDGLPCHFETVAPAHEAAGLRATFYVPIFDSVIRYRDRWRELASHGHEIGNHSLFHPCLRDPGREWLDPAYDLHSYTPRRWKEEMAVANDALHQIDGLSERTFGNTCYDITIGPASDPVLLETLMPPFFSAARGQQAATPVDLDHLNRYNLGTKDIDYLTFEQVRADIEAAAASGGWVIFTMHGIGEGTHRLFVDSQEHARLVQWLGENRSRIWTAPLRDVVRHLTSQHVS